MGGELLNRHEDVIEGRRPDHQRYFSCTERDSNIF